MSPRLAAAAKVVWVLVLLAAVVAFAAARTHKRAAPHLVGIKPAMFRHFNEGGTLVGRGADTVILFSRYNCRFCAAMLTDLDSTITRHPGALTVRIRHFAPPATDSTAFLAAVAADCAGQQGRFLAASVWLASHFDEFARTHGRSVPTAVGIRDTIAFSVCSASDEARFKVVSDVMAAVELRVTGTPTSLARTYRINGIATTSELLALARRK